MQQVTAGAFVKLAVPCSASLHCWPTTCSCCSHCVSPVICFLFCCWAAYWFLFFSNYGGYLGTYILPQLYRIKFSFLLFFAMMLASLILFSHAFLEIKRFVTARLHWLNFGHAGCWGIFALLTPWIGYLHCQTYGALGSVLPGGDVLDWHYELERRFPSCPFLHGRLAGIDRDHFYVGAGPHEHHSQHIYHRKYPINRDVIS